MSPTSDAMSAAWTLPRSAAIPDTGDATAALPQFCGTPRRLGVNPGIWSGLVLL
jgi:hypothetical protein